jgi:hypothetical protein
MEEKKYKNYFKCRMSIVDLNLNPNGSGPQSPEPAPGPFYVNGLGQQIGTSFLFNPWDVLIFSITALLIKFLG